MLRLTITPGSLTAMEAFAQIEPVAQGVDFVAGTTDISIAIQALKSGQQFWVCSYRRRQIKTPFRAG